MHKPNHLIGISILHYGKWQITLDCLNSLLTIDQQKYPFLLTVVDNSQRHNTQQKITNHPLKPHLITPNTNTGFAEGNNLAIRHLLAHQSTAVILLNNDTIVDQHFLKPFYTHLIQNHPPAILGPVIRHKVSARTYYDLGGYIEKPTFQPLHINLNSNYHIQNQHPDTQITLLKPAIKQLKHNNGTQLTINRDFVTGCCMFIPKKIIQTIGTLNESYFMYLEDVEYCLRAQQHNFPTQLLVNAQIYHLGSQSSTLNLKIYYSLKNSFKLIYSYAPTKYLLPAYLYHFIFYPTIWLKWHLKALYKKLTKNSPHQ